MFKSIDGGQNFKQLNWPKARPIKQVLFDQTGQYGYIADVYITAIQSAPEQGLYFLTEKFDFSDFNLQSNKKSAQFIYLSKDKKQHLVELGDRLMLGHLYQGKDGVLVIVGSKVSESYLRFEDMYLISTDQGQSWSFHNNESSATGQTFDTQTNRLWKLENAKLYSKQLD